MFSDALPLAEHYASLLCGVGVDRGLIGPRETPRIWTRHLLNCAVVTDGVAEGSCVADVGTGAGLPGVVWAIRRSDIQMVLVEPLLRRATFLRECVDELGLSNRVGVERARAEDLNVEGGFDVVTSRAVAPLRRLVPWCAPLCRPGGTIVALKGRSATEEIDAAGRVIGRVSRGGATLRTYGRGLVDPPTVAVEIPVDRSAGAAQ